jgi:hypothetical protein
VSVETRFGDENPNFPLLAHRPSYGRLRFLVTGVSVF